jgi:hypothetical protein
MVRTSQRHEKTALVQLMRQPAWGDCLAVIHYTNLQLLEIRATRFQSPVRLFFYIR